MLHKILTLVIAISLIFSHAFATVNASRDSGQKFIVTAYYSPLPNQTHYIMGNYEAEIRMNGKGIRGASGKKVFSGMLAAPGKYAFGTKISLHGLGIGEVADRGGAIVQAGERNFAHDRIDVWVGWGEEGLQRAMYWGNRTIKGTVIGGGNTPSIKISSIPAPNWTITYARKNPDYIHPKKQIPQNKTNTTEKNKETDIFSGPISDSLGVKKLQEVLSELDLYNEKIDGEYSSIRLTILDFQLEHQVITAKTDTGAGNYGPKTRKKLSNIYADFLTEKAELEKNQQQYISKLKATTQQIAKLGELQQGDVSSEVRKLQVILKKLGFFKHKDTAIFGEKTTESLVNYQVSKKIIKDTSSVGAGLFGPQTKKALSEDLARL